MKTKLTYDTPQTEKLVMRMEFNCMSPYGTNKKIGDLDYDTIDDWD